MGVVIESTIFYACRSWNLFLISSFPAELPPSLFARSHASVMESLWSVFGEFELDSQGGDRAQMVIYLCYGYAAAFFASPFLGVLSDLIEKDLYPSTTAILAMYASLCTPEDGKKLYKHHLLRIKACPFMRCDRDLGLNSKTEPDEDMLLGPYNSSKAPIWKADGREVHLGLMYTCFLGARILGSTVFPWLTSGPLSLRTEDCVVYAYILMGLVLSIAAYDYQEIGVLNLITLFCLFHDCVGLILPYLVRLRTMYVPNELRGGMIGLAFTPSNAAILISLVQGGYSWNIGNAALMSFSVFGLLTAAGCMHSLKQSYHNWHKQ
ncbi:hypothetical protein L6164_027890 [Bauhinia variegata]|uniref:Uncharacterized protein n=1 Tax=Bauhinia variegata TaxID=167791 RepID=A0ACB9LVG4_BAUVA|nr:hypothetical protein L6164_027890 [Bauhinia variegata]